MTLRTSITYRDFTCPAGHEFRAAIRSTSTADPDTDPTAFYRVAESGAQWLPIPKCPTPECPLIGEVRGSGPRQFASVPEAERFEAWLSPDGSLLSVPGAKGRPMPERYRRVGYVKVEAQSIRDLDRFDAIRSAQTGNDAYNEYNYTPGQRRERQEAEYNDDMKSEV